MRIKRRQFLGSAAVAAAVTIVSRHVPGGPRFVAPSAKVNVALVGAGGQGRTNTRILFQEPDAQVIAVADAAEHWDLDAFHFIGDTRKLLTEGRAGQNRLLPYEKTAARKRPTKASLLPACCWFLLFAGLLALGDRPAALGSEGHQGATLYVSKRGDNSDGSSWRKAFHTIQQALSAVPNDKGGHRVLIRPDTYVEANLHPAHKGAAGAYNMLSGDVDGSLGSGATGWVVIDSSCPGVAVRLDPTRQGAFKIVESRLPESGFKCVDWWAPWRCDPYHSGVSWDRWTFRHLYATGSEGGIGWDMTCQRGCPFSAIVEDCVGIGRFAGACVIAHVGRKDEPNVFRRCYFLNLDWWGDAGGVYVRGENRTPPSHPDATFEDCTIIGPDNALQAAWPGVDELYTRVQFVKCRLIVLNFSQPRGTPSSGIICCGSRSGKQLRVDFQDCTLAGFKVFGVRSGEVSYTTQGRCEAYVQFEQTVPAGFQRLGLWPVELFQHLAPPKKP